MSSQELYPELLILRRKSGFDAFLPFGVEELYLLDDVLSRFLSGYAAIGSLGGVPIKTRSFPMAFGTVISTTGLLRILNVFLSDVYVEPRLLQLFLSFGIASFGNLHLRGIPLISYNFYHTRN